ncbi:enoyl-CoA hydratase/isomerase family protein [Rhodoligotrophos ferricapiens]|uniref:enoyl-CoA hydratase/isomerase family protein n=1 Tax=Rhodoligotrophos ferricapiens TaxID=3069264 RepID=UPI00315D515F
MSNRSITEPGEDDPACCVMQQNGTTLIWLNEPKRRNALSQALRDILIPAMSAAMEDPSTRTIILAGSGGCFCAGGDLAGLRNQTPAGAHRRMRASHSLIRTIQTGPKPIIAAVEGWAAGAGASLAAACDIVIAAADARFALPFGKVGLAPDLGALHTLPARIGIGRTRLLAITGRSFSAEEALQWGLVEEIAPAGQAVMQAMAMAEEINKTAPIALAATKQLLARYPSSLDELLAAEENTQAVLFLTEDFEEGAKAFLEKRKPQFRGE